MPRTISDVGVVANSVDALIGFCRNHGLPNIPTTVLVEFVIAVREGGSFEWTTDDAEFSRIYFAGSAFNRIAIVERDEEQNDSLSFELNAAMFDATKGLAGLRLQSTV